MTLVQPASVIDRLGEDKHLFGALLDKQLTSFALLGCHNRLRPIAQIHSVSGATVCRRERDIQTWRRRGVVVMPYDPRRRPDVVPATPVDYDPENYHQQPISWTSHLYTRASAIVANMCTSVRHCFIRCQLNRPDNNMCLAPQQRCQRCSFNKETLPSIVQNNRFLLYRYYRSLSRLSLGLYAINIAWRCNGCDGTRDTPNSRRGDSLPNDSNYDFKITWASERKHSWAARFTPRWPQFYVLQRCKDRSYHYTWYFLFTKKIYIYIYLVKRWENISVSGQLRLIWLANATLKPVPLECQYHENKCAKAPTNMTYYCQGIVPNAIGIR